MKLYDVSKLQSKEFNKAEDSMIEKGDKGLMVVTIAKLNAQNELLTNKVRNLTTFRGAFINLLRCIYGGNK